ncbi:hypothetical protein Dimus_010852 [Dionaea muscipula]
MSSTRLHCLSGSVIAVHDDSKFDDDACSLKKELGFMVGPSSTLSLFLVMGSTREEEKGDRPLSSCCSLSKLIMSSAMAYVQPEDEIGGSAHPYTGEFGLLGISAFCPEHGLLSCSIAAARFSVELGHAYPILCSAWS